MTRKPKGIRLAPCPSSCMCLCHDTSGGIQEKHEHGICSGKFLTNSAADIATYQTERSTKVAIAAIEQEA